MNQLYQEFKFTETQLFILQNHYKSCPIHSEGWITQLSNSTEVSQQLLCAECISENPNQNTITISTILKSDEKTVFKNWPVIGDQELNNKLQEISTRKSFVEDLQQRINAYFKQLREEINNKITQKETQMMNNAKSLWNLNEQVMISYNHYSGKDQIKDIIKNKKDDFEEQNKLLKLEISRIFQNLQRNKQSIIDSISLLKSQEEMINFDTPNLLRENILKSIENIDMFTIKNFHDIKINSIEDDIDSYKNKIMQMKPSEITTSQLIINLISNKLNNCSKELLDKLFRIIKSISSFLDKQNVKESISEDVLLRIGDKLSNTQLNEIMKLIQEFEKSNENLKNDQAEEKKEGDDKIFESLISIFEQKINYCSQEFIQNSKHMVESYPEILKNILLKTNIFDKNQISPIKFDCLDDGQMKNIEQLVKKITELNNKFGDDYKKGDLKFLKEQKFIDDACCLAKGRFNMKNFKQLLINYPIVELEDIFLREKINLEFIKTTFSKSQSLILELNQSGDTVIKQHESLFGQIVTIDSLDPDLNYIFRCKANKSLLGNYISIGLIKTQNINSNELSTYNCCFRRQNNNMYGLQKIIKGSNLNSVNDICNLEIRVNIRRQQLIFSDYPQYNNINSANPENIEKNQQYSFGVCFNTPGNDYIIQITDILITDDHKFAKFEQL